MGLFKQKICCICYTFGSGCNYAQFHFLDLYLWLANFKFFSKFCLGGHGSCDRSVTRVVLKTEWYLKSTTTTGRHAKATRWQHQMSNVTGKCDFPVWELACSRLRDSGEKSFSKKKCEKRAEAGERLACVASASVWFRSKEIPRKGVFRYWPREKWNESQKVKEGEGGGEGSFGFIEISPWTPSTRSKIQKKIILVSQTSPLKFISAPLKAKHFVGQLWQLMTASNVGARTQAWQAKWVVFKIPGFVCKRFLPFFPTPSRSFTYAIFRAVFDSRSSFFSPKPHRNAYYAG